jgi:diacylglycerol kinase
MVLVAATVLRCDLVEWCLLLGAIGLMLTAELCRGAVQAVVQNISHHDRKRCGRALDIAAAAGLVASLAAAIVGAAIFANRLIPNP